MRHIPSSFRRLAVKLPAFAILSALACAICVGYLTYNTARNELISVDEAMLQANVNLRSNTLDSLGDRLYSDLALLSENQNTYRMFYLMDSTYPSDEKKIKELQSTYIDKNPLPPGKRSEYLGEADSSEYGFWHQKWHPAMKAISAEKGYYDIFMINLNGEVVYTVEKESDFATNLRKGPWKSSGLARAFDGALKAATERKMSGTSRPNVHFEDYEHYAPSQGEPAAFAASAIHDERGNALGVIAIQLPSKLIADAISQPIGRTGKAYAVAEDNTLRTLIAGENKLQILSKLPDNSIFKTAGNQKSWSVEGLSSSGQPAMLAVTASEFMGKKWYMAVEMELAEVHEPIARMGRQLLVTSVGLVLLICVVGYLFARSIYRPILGMRDAVAVLANGAETNIPGEKRSDELGELARALRQIHETGVAAARIKSALDHAGTNVMIADSNNRLIYANKALLSFFADHSAEFRRQYPNFSAEQMIGTALEAFRDVPGHGLAAGTEPLRKQIRIDTLTVELVVNAVVDASGTRIGTIVEWNNLTAEMNAMGEVAEVVEAATRGDFTARIREDNKTGLVRHLSGGINRINILVESATEELSSALSLMASGDLNNRISTQYDGVFDTLAKGINDTMQKLAETVATIQHTTLDITSAAREINAGAVDLARRTEDEAASLEETAATTEELAASVKQTAESSHAATQLSDKAKAVAAEGGAIVGDAIDAIGLIENASRQISEIVGVIDDIAFQTNLLALNAAVEAARAGDAGKGFAVVASEVRTLAQRSSQAAKDIKGLINSSEAQVSAGARLVRATGQSLTSIVAASQQVAETVNVISAATAEQSSGIEEMSQTVARIDQMTQQNSALAEQSAASANQLIMQIERLNSLVATFKVDHQGQAQTYLQPASGTSEPDRLRQLAEAAFAESKVGHGSAHAVRRKPDGGQPSSAPRMAQAGRAMRDTWDEF